MLSVIVATNESERVLVRTLAGLVPGATAGLIRDVILADAGSTDETAEIGDIAGCRFLSLPGPLGPRLAAAAAMARGEWLMFLSAGVELDPGWVAEVTQFIERASENVAAIFTAGAKPQGQSLALARIDVGISRPQLAAQAGAGPADLEDVLPGTRQPSRQRRKRGRSAAPDRRVADRRASQQPVAQRIACRMAEILDFVK